MTNVDSSDPSGDDAAATPASDAPGTTLLVERIVAGGDGIARHPDGRAVLIPRSAPGDRVEVEYTEEHRQWLRARLLRLVDGAPERCDPPCPHYSVCGGCQLQHLRYEAQLSAKAGIVADSLRRLGGFEIEAPGVVPSPKQFGYRNRITLLLRRHTGGTVVGYHSLARPSRLVEIDNCPLAERPINTIWSALRSELKRVGRSAQPGTEWRLTFRADSTGHVGLAVEGVARPRDVARPVMEELVAGGLSAVWLVNEEGRIVARAGAETLSEQWGPYDIPLAGTAFVQVNREVAARLDARVIERCRVAGARVIDGYCGFGLRAFELAAGGAEVMGIDSDRHAVRAAEEIAAARGLSIRFAADRVENVLAQQLPADFVILNPPRGGVAPEVVEALLRVPAGGIVYASCNPATLARDLKRLSPVYKIRGVEAFDLFPQTSSVESVVTLAPAASSDV